MQSPGLGGGGSRGVRGVNSVSVTFKNMVPAQTGPVVSATARCTA